MPSELARTPPRKAVASDLPRYNRHFQSVRLTREERFFLDAARLTRIYWFIRYERFRGRARKYYRHAAKEKARLAGLGHDSELVRLYCLHLADPRREQRKIRFFEHLSQPEQLSLFPACF